MATMTLNKTFKGGIHPGEHKELTEDKPYEIMPAPEEVYIPLSQHIGKPGKPGVKKRGEVIKGMVLAEPDGFISAAIHSPVSGKVKDISQATHAGGKPKEAIVIKVDESEEVDFMEELDPNAVDSDAIIERVKQAGIVGQGGAAFPTFVKLMPPQDKKIEWLIINGAECEPYLTRDYRFMLERSEDLLEGVSLLMKALKIDKAIIGIETNKPKAIDVLSKLTEKSFPNIHIYGMKTKYPQGAEKMLIKAAINREVPPGKLPMDVGVVIQNIGTAIAVFDAVVKGEPEITAALTVSGGGINEPKNLIVPVGTPIKDVIEFCGGIKPNAKKVVVGGPMMGVAQYDLSAPVMKATSGILILSDEEVQGMQEYNCVRCGKCIEICPVNLMPTNIARYSQLNRLEDAEKYGITTCMECGTCSYNCPSGIPLVQWIRLGKQRVISMQRSRKN